MVIYNAPILKYFFAILFSLIRGCLKFQEKFGSIRSAFKFRALIKNAGSGCSCHYSVEIKYPENIVIGDSTRIGPKSTLGGYGGIRIGSNVVVSKNVLIESAGLDFKNNSVPYKHKAMPIIIEDEVWIGANAIILGGVTIGKGSIIGAGAVVSKSLPEKSIMVQASTRILTN
tara:strand:+ start:3940 stop:4455 length:516 start_codon:yes stop_codon:yes gene_type:complete